LYRRLAAGENKGKHDFSDPAYDKVRFSMNDRFFKKLARLARPECEIVIFYPGDGWLSW
jgi:hypothetical protein